jgi:hypothetical protein
MFRKKKKRLSHTELDDLGTEIIKAAALGDQETQESASSQFLFARVRAEIDARKKRDAGSSNSRAMLAPVSGESIFGRFELGKLKLGLAALFVVAATGFWTVWARSIGRPASRVSAPQEAGLTACSLSNADKCVISTNEVVQLVVNGNSREPGK